MANRHFAEIGDVWKHLSLAELLPALGVRAYWESHAGSAGYALTPSPARTYGALRFAALAAGSPVLAASRYAGLLAEAAARGRYPGSPAIALALAPGAEFLFCDLDPDSLATIREEAASRGVAAGRVRAVAADGIATLWDELERESDEDVRGTFVFLDPYRHLEPGANGRNAVELLARAARRGARTVLWYGFATLATRDDLLAAFGAAGALAGTWRAEVWPEFIEQGGEDPDGSHIGAGILCANLGEGTRTTCRELGRALVTLYAGATLADGRAGALRYGEDAA